MLPPEPKAKFLFFELPAIIIRFNNLQAQDQLYVVRRQISSLANLKHKTTKKSIRAKCHKSKHKNYGTIFSSQTVYQNKGWQWLWNVSLNNFLTAHLKLQSMSVHVSAMQLIGKKGLKASLLNKCPPLFWKPTFLTWNSAQSSFYPLYRNPAEWTSSITWYTGDRSILLMVPKQHKLFNAAHIFWCHSKHKRNHISKPFSKSLNVHMANNLSFTFPN